MMLFCGGIAFGQTQPHWLQIRGTPATTQSVKDWGAIGDGITDDTLSIQAAIDSGNNLVFPDGNYLVSTINFNRNDKRYVFNNAKIVGIASSTEPAIIQITNRYIDLIDLRVDGGKRPGNTAAIHWYSPTAWQPAEWVRITNLDIRDCNIGILFGQLVGSAVVDAPQSENVVTNYLTRGVRVPIYTNQPNGFLTLLAPQLDCFNYEYSVAQGAYPSTASYAVYNNAILQIIGGELLKTAENTGYSIHNSGGLLLTNVGLELAAPILNEGRLVINGNVGGYSSLDTKPMLYNSGYCSLRDVSFSKPSGTSAYSQMPFLTNTASNSTLNIDGSTFQGLLLNKVVGRASDNFATMGNIHLHNVSVDSTSQTTVSNVTSNLWEPLTECAASTTSWVISLGGGAAASHTLVPITNHPAGYATASEVLGELGQTTSIELPIIPISYNRGLTFEYWFKFISGEFRSTSQVEYLASDGVTPVGSTFNLSAEQGEGSIAAGSTSPVDWQKVTYIIPPVAGASYIRVKLRQSNVGVIQRTGFVIRQ